MKYKHKIVEKEIKTHTSYIFPETFSMRRDGPGGQGGDKNTYACVAKWREKNYTKALQISVIKGINK